MLFSQLNLKKSRFVFLILNDLDRAVANSGSGNASVLLNNGNGSFAAVVNFGAGNFPASVALGDLDNDSDLDMAVANFGSSVCLNSKFAAEG